MPSGVYKRTKPVWNKGLTKETDDRILKAEIKKQQTNLERYGVTNVLQSKEILDKCNSARHNGELAFKASQTKLERYGDSHYNNIDKCLCTKLERYGDSHYNNQDKYKKTCLDKYGFIHPNKSRIMKEQISKTRYANNSSQKAKETIIRRYNSMDNYNKITSLKRYETMKKNKTIGSVESKPEKELYEKLCKQFGKNNVVKQYYDKERYPFRCDFYIKSEDLFIELNKFWTHNTHPFDCNNPKDIEELEKLRLQNDEWAKQCIYVWTDLDVRKQQTALKNNLNFKMIY